jgi:glycosyltransferase involved in cell wall biosynthesis
MMGNSGHYEKIGPLISVIVPIYNVEKYVRKCLDSLLHQTLKQIEIICIDDGSTDGSGAVAEEYRSDEYPIFRIIHTENSGLSAARNRGIAEAQAEWLMFVDSDDWVEYEFCEIPWIAAKEYLADLVIFNSRIIKNNKRINKQSIPSQHYGLVSHESAIEFGDVVAWNKLYKHSLFD